jgi:ribonuclease Z
LLKCKKKILKTIFEVVKNLKLMLTNPFEEINFMKFELTILGTSAAVPYKNRFLSGQILNVQNELFLIDCGEAIQFRFLHLGIKHSRLNHIFISHLHGDHCFGIFGLLTSMAMMGRENALHIYAPEGLKSMVEAVFKATYYQSPFKIHFYVLNTEGAALVFENEKLSVISFPLNHRVPTCGFVFREKPFFKNIISEKIKELSLDFESIKAIKKGFDYENTEGVVYPNDTLTLPPLLPRSFAYCSDTTYFEAILPYIEGVDLLYHEATFLNDMKEHAFDAGHTTAFEAGLIAQKASVNQLIIGHFSARYDDLEALLFEAKTQFPNTVLGIDGQSYSVELKRLESKLSQ